MQTIPQSNTKGANQALSVRPSLEKVASAAARMAMSVPQFYRVAARDGIPIIKVGARASAVSVEDVDSWIAGRIGIRVSAAPAATANQSIATRLAEASGQRR
jgi:hypothetical protein